MARSPVRAVATPGVDRRVRRRQPRRTCRSACCRAELRSRTFCRPPYGYIGPGGPNLRDGCATKTRRHAPAGIGVGRLAALDGVLCQLSVRDDPALRRLALVVDVEDVDDLVLVRLSAALERAVHQGDDVLVVGHDVVKVELDVLQLLRIPGDRPDGGFFALEIAAEYAAAGMPNIVIGPRVGQGFHIAPHERVERIANQLDLLVETELRGGFCHLRPPLSPFGLDPARTGMTTLQGRL